MKIPATIEWVRAFDAQAIEDDLPHLGALCVFMFGTARIGEACRMIWGDVDLHQRTAKLYLFKPAPWSREAHLPPELVAVLANLPSNRKADELVFDYSGRGSLRGAWNNVCKRAGIQRLTLHCSRHGFATSMLHMGMDVKTVAEMGG
ncbi:MAG: tyrosine-type recombinase/integrase [Paracoccus sp. (in: a-proteobacteria)]|uniref:tyrosine-type recombinase/integrase n=1 Tax=Paracoccus sp. TaxID=267 RepID=UPI004059E4DD